MFVVANHTVGVVASNVMAAVIVIFASSNVAIDVGVVSSCSPPVANGVLSFVANTVGLL